jgi:hypothetical protein
MTNSVPSAETKLFNHQILTILLILPKCLLALNVEIGLKIVTNSVPNAEAEKIMFNQKNKQKISVKNVKEKENTFALVNFNILEFFR